MRDGCLRKSEVGNNDGNFGLLRYVIIFLFFEIYVFFEVVGFIDENLVWWFWKIDRFYVVLIG